MLLSKGYSVMLDVRCLTERDAKWVGTRWCASGKRRSAVLRRSRLSYVQLETACSIYLYLDGDQVRHLVVDHTNSDKLLHNIWPTSSRRSFEVIDRYLHQSIRKQLRNRMSSVDWDNLCQSAFKRTWAAANVTDFEAALSDWVDRHIASPKKFGSPLYPIAHPFWKQVSEEVSRKLRKKLTRASER